MCGCYHSRCPLPTRDMFARAYTRRVSYRERIHGALIKSILTTSTLEILATCLGADWHEATRGVSWAIVHLYPHISPLSSLAQFTDKSFVTFCKRQLYGSYAFSSRKVAYYSRYSTGTPCSSAITMFIEEKPVPHTKAKEGFDDSSFVRGLRP